MQGGVSAEVGGGFNPASPSCLRKTLYIYLFFSLFYPKAASSGAAPAPSEVRPPCPPRR